MNLQDVAIIGAGGFGREVLDIFDAINQIKTTFNVIGFIVDPQYASKIISINDKPVLGGIDWLEKKRRIKVICAIGEPKSRFQVVMRAMKAGVQFCSIVHPTAIITRWVTIGVGSVIAAGCILTNKIVIGNHVHINLDCTIGHDVIINDFTTLSPGVHVSGKVKLNEGCYIGTGSNIIDNKEIGTWSVIGAGSTIINNVPSNTTVVGVPGKVVKTRTGGWHLI
jgi:sugar O-acyltransferase (sialic acid O-acetyltransferase NeuD family)